MEPSIGAVIVTYQCETRIQQVAKAILPQVTRLVIVDNGSNMATLTALDQLAAQYPTQVTLLKNAENLGLATAQNQGIRAALAAGCAWVLLLDDDSIADAAMVPTMLKAWQEAGDAQIGIVAPRYVEQNIATPSRYLVPVGRFAWQRQPVGEGEQLRQALTVIASGSLVQRSVFEQAGLMADGLFIDYVDHEFCLRARAQGFSILVVGDAKLYHRQGNKTEHGVAGATVATANYGPKRRYFIFRNRLFVLRRYARSWPFLIPYELAACGWDFARVMAFEDNKWQKLQAMVRGMREGLSKTIPSAATL